MIKNKKAVLPVVYPAFGALPSPKDLRDYQISKAACAVDLPESFDIKHSHIKNQRTVNSCVAHAVSEILEACDGTNYTTGWIYGYRPSNYYQGEGMFVSNAIKTVYKLGAVINKDFDHNVELPKAKELVNNDLERLTELAKDHKVLSYAKLSSNTQIKQAVYQNETPVLMSVPTDENGLKLDRKNVAIIPTKVGGFHAVVCYGWNEKGFLIQNSWGTNWGNGGCFVLPYDYAYSEAWLLTKDKEMVEKPSLYTLRDLIQHIINWLRIFINKIKR